MLKYKRAHTCTEGTALIWALSPHSLWCLNPRQRWQGFETEPGALLCKKWHALLAVVVAAGQVLGSASSTLCSALPTEQEGKHLAAPADFMPNLFRGPWTARRVLDLLGESLCGPPICSIRSPLPGPGGGEGAELLYKQSFKINCFSSLEQELAFQPRGTMRVCSDCIFSWAVYSQGVFVRGRLRFLGEMNQAPMCSILPRLETVMMLMVVITVCLQLQAGCLFISFVFSLGFVLWLHFGSCLSWSVAACCALIWLINPKFLIGRFTCLKFCSWQL